MANSQEQPTVQVNPEPDQTVTTTVEPEHQTEGEPNDPDTPEE